MSSRLAPIGLNKIPIIRIFVPFASGVLTGQEWGMNLKAEFQLIIVSGIWLFLLLLFIRNRMDQTAGHLCFGCFGFLLFLGLGFFSGRMTVQEPPDFPAGREVLVRGWISGEPEQAGDRWRTEMELSMLATGDTLLLEKTILEVSMGMSADSLYPGEGEEWQLAGTLQPVRNYGNPGETDYVSMLGRRGTWFRFYVEMDSPWNRRIGSSRMQRFRASAIRESISRHWQGDPEAVVLLKAVCLGDRSQLTRELRDSYAGAGGMHLLAVSGLHVGLIWWVLQHLFSFLVRMTRSELGRVIPTLILLWCYAYLTGMTASVSSSVMMFTLFTVARL
ncbi:MAG: ComEC/Rec2 family competence protein, partial [Bacteroidales bacterium]